MKNRSVKKLLFTVLSLLTVSGVFSTIYASPSLSETPDADETVCTPSPPPKDPEDTSSKAPKDHEESGAIDERLISFAGDISYILGESNGVVSSQKAVKAHDDDNGEITYSLGGGHDFLKIDIDTGEVTISDYTKAAEAISAAPEKILSVKVTAEKSESDPETDSGIGTVPDTETFPGTDSKPEIDKPPVYAQANADYTIYISFLDTPENPYAVSSKRPASDGWYSCAVTVSPSDSEKYGISKSCEPETFKEHISFDDQGSQKRFFYLRDTKTGGMTDRIILDGIAIDTVSPVMSVSFSPETAVYSGQAYYNGSASVTFTIEEENFFSEDVSVTVSENGAVPYPVKLSWTDRGGSLHTGTYTFDKDGDYVISLSYADPALNMIEPYRSHIITVDTTAPSMDISYSTPARKENGISYYSESISAVLSISEADFFPEDVHITVSPTGGTAYEISPEWTYAGGNIHKAGFTMYEDGNYVITVSYTDRAGNKMPSYTSGQLTLDTKAAPPSFSINGAPKEIDGGSYNGSADIHFEFYDENFDTQTATLIKTGPASSDDVTDEFIEVHGSTNGGYGEFSVPSSPEYDGIYELTVEISDKANNKARASFVFTINRFGSVYVYSDYLASLIKDGGQYISLENGNKSAVTNDLVITEYNANRLTNGAPNILMTLDGEFIDAQYTVRHEIKSAASETESGWNKYVYVIKKENFMRDGLYRITLSSEYKTDDSARNGSLSVPENSFLENNDPVDGGICFTVDTTPPYIRSISNLDNAVINASQIEAGYTVIDAGGLKSIEIIVNGRPLDTITSFGENRFNFSGSFSLTERPFAQTIRLRITDLAGNVTDTASPDFRAAVLFDFNDSVLLSSSAYIRPYEVPDPGSENTAVMQNEQLTDPDAPAQNISENAARPSAAGTSDSNADDTARASADIAASSGAENDTSHTAGGSDLLVFIIFPVCAAAALFIIMLVKFKK